MATDLFLVTPTSDVTDDASFVERTATIGTRGTGSTFLGTNTVAGPTAGLQVTNGQGSLPVYWYSPRLNAVTISGTVTLNIWGFESSMNANAGYHVRLDRVSSTGVFISTILDSDRAVEMATAVSVHNWTVTPTSTTLASGDRLRITVFLDDAGGNMASGFQVQTHFNGTSAGATGDTYVRVTETLSAYTPPPLLASAGGSSTSSGTAAAVAVVFQRLAPDAILTQTNLTGAVADIDEDPDSPDASWLTGGGAVVLRVSFPSPAADLVAGATQEFRVRVRPGT